MNKTKLDEARGSSVDMKKFGSQVTVIFSEIRASLFQLKTDLLDFLAKLDAVFIGVDKISNEIRRLEALACNAGDRYLDADQARQYLAGMSVNTFDKYRYGSQNRIIGRKVGGKTFYKKSELDYWVDSFESNSERFHN
jgi:hypothetical protein